MNPIPSPLRVLRASRLKNVWTLRFEDFSRTIITTVRVKCQEKDESFALTQELIAEGAKEARRRFDVMEKFNKNPQNESS